MKTNNPPNTMRAVVLTGHGGLDKLEYPEKWPKPTLSAGEVLVKVSACGLNNTDINTRTAWYSNSVKESITASGSHIGYSQANQRSDTWGRSTLALSRIQGADIIGVIHAVAYDVEPSRIGERVMVDPWILSKDNWMDVDNTMYVDSEYDGGFAEYTKIPNDNAISISSDWTDAELATIPCAYGTTENLISRSTPLSLQGHRVALVLQRFSYAD